MFARKRPAGLGPLGATFGDISAVWESMTACRSSSVNGSQSRRGQMSAHPGPRHTTIRPVTLLPTSQYLYIFHVGAWRVFSSARDRLYLFASLRASYAILARPFGLPHPFTLHQSGDCRRHACDPRPESRQLGRLPFNLAALVIAQPHEGVALGP